MRKGRRIRVAGVRVYDHLAFDGSGDFDAAIFEARRNRRNFPRAFPNVPGVREEVRVFAGGEFTLAFDTARQKLVARSTETALEGGQEA